MENKEIEEILESTEVVDQQNMHDFVKEIDEMLNEPPKYMTSTVLSIDMSFTELIRNFSCILFATAPTRWRYALLTLRELASYTNNNLYNRRKKMRTGALHMLWHGRNISRLLMRLFWLIFTKKTVKVPYGPKQSRLRVVH